MTTLSVRTSDATPPYSVLATGGLDVAAGDEVEVVPATPGRVAVDLCLAEGTGPVWLGIGQTAVARSGLYLLNGDVFEQFYDGAIRVLNSGPDTARLTWVEWGA